MIGRGGGLRNLSPLAWTSNFELYRAAMTYANSVSADLALQLHAFISMLAQESDLSPANIKKKLPANLEPYINKRAFSKRLLNQARHYRTRMQLGKFRAALMAGVGLLEMAFLQEIERDGLL